MNKTIINLLRNKNLQAAAAAGDIATFRQILGKIKPKSQSDDYAQRAVIEQMNGEYSVVHEKLAVAWAAKEAGKSPRAAVDAEFGEHEFIEIESNFWDGTSITLYRGMIVDNVDVYNYIKSSETITASIEDGCLKTNFWGSKLRKNQGVFLAIIGDTAHLLLPTNLKGFASAADGICIVDGDRGKQYLTAYKIDDINLNQTVALDRRAQMMGYLSALVTKIVVYENSRSKKELSIEIL